MNNYKESKVPGKPRKQKLKEDTRKMKEIK